MILLVIWDSPISFIIRTNLYTKKTFDAENNNHRLRMRNSGWIIDGISMLSFIILFFPVLLIDLKKFNILKFFIYPLFSLNYPLSILIRHILYKRSLRKLATTDSLKSHSD